MFSFAATPTDLAMLFYPWWVTNALVPAGIAILGSLLTLGISWLLARKTELYRRLSRWEPYGEQLRSRQIELYAQICTTARKAMIATGDYVWNRNNNPDDDRPLRQAMVKITEELELLRIMASILLSSQFNPVYEQFTHELGMFADSSPEKHPKEREYAQEYSDKARKLYVDLLRVARKSIGTDPLDEKARNAILDGLSRERWEAPDSQSSKQEIAP